jgi:MYXO-CTERM domain-containing protein
MILAAGLGVPTTVSAQTYVNLPGTQPNGLADGAPMGDSNACGVTCHFSRDETMLSAMPYDTWIGSMMGNTMRDPLFLAALTVAEQDVPGVGDYCLRCHTPPGFVGGRTRMRRQSSLGVDLTAADRDGVSCDSCHRMLPTTNLGNAQYVLSPTEVRFGPHPTIDSIRHPGAVSTWLADSRMCATCHDITNPLQPQLLPDGTDTGRRFPLDTTYSEWAQSDFARAGSSVAATCQDCHMPRLGMPGFTSTNKTAMRRENPRRHDFAGINAWGLRVLAQMRNDVASGEFYDPDLVPFYEAGARRAEAMLRSAVTLEIREAPTTVTAGSQATVVVRVTNRSGHRVPTGYADGRRMWLEVALVDANNREVVISGAYDTNEAHLDTNDRQLKVYEAHHGRAGMGHGEHIALHNAIFKDTRIPPQGYRPLPGHEPVGADYSGGANGTLRHWDDARYTFTVPSNLRGPLRLRVRARFQVTTREYVEFLQRENRTDDRGNELLRRYNASGRAAPFDMAEVTRMLTLTGGMQGDGGVDGGVTPPAQSEGGCSLSVSGEASSRTAWWAALLAVASLARRRTRR